MPSSAPTGTCRVSLAAFPVSVGDLVSDVEDEATSGGLSARAALTRSPARNDSSCTCRSFVSASIKLGLALNDEQREAQLDLYRFVAIWPTRR